MSRLRLAVLLVVAISAGAAALAIQDAKKKNPNTVDIVSAAEIPVVAGTRLSSGGTYDNQPAVAESADGTTWIASIRYHNAKADEVVVYSRKGEKASEPQVLTPAPGQYIRPALAASGSDVWCVWTTSQPDKVASIWVARRTGDSWTPAARLLTGDTPAHQ